MAISAENFLRAPPQTCNAIKIARHNVGRLEKLAVAPLLAQRGRNINQTPPQPLMINQGSSEALTFSRVINCGSESRFHHGARHCRYISARPRDALQGSLEGLDPAEQKDR